MVKKKTKKKKTKSEKIRRRLLGYRRRDVDARIAGMQAELTRRTEDLESEVGRLTEQLAAATTADEDLAFRATRRAVEAILHEANTEAVGVLGGPVVS